MTINWRTTAAKLCRGLRTHILHPELVQAAPLAAFLLVVSIIIATGNFTLDQRQIATVDQGIEALQQAPDNLRARLADAYDAGQINEAQYQVELERLNRLTPLFQQYAQHLDEAADIQLGEMTRQAILEILLAGNPAEMVGKGAETYPKLMR